MHSNLECAHTLSLLSLTLPLSAFVYMCVYAYLVKCLCLYKIPQLDKHRLETVIVLKKAMHPKRNFNNNSGYKF